MLPKIWRTKQLTIINSSLAVISSNHDRDDTWIWVMKEYNNDAAWYVHFKIKVDQFDVLDVLQPITNGELHFNRYKNEYHIYKS